MEGAASVWEEEVIIPTYPVGEPERNPIFLENRVYQGSSGAVYPLPVIERLNDEKEDRTYHAVFLENEYLKVMILPELGGRVQMAYAKTLDYHFVYYNRVIKPALVGLAGPWISGGIEFNWPQHHRPSTFMPVDHVIEKAEEGRATVWLAETDRMRGSRSVAGLSPVPGKSVPGSFRATVESHALSPDLSLVGESRRASQRPVPVRLSAGRQCRLRSWKTGCLPVSHSNRDILQGGLFSRRGHFLVPEHPGAYLVHGLSLGLRLRGRLRSREERGDPACGRPPRFPGEKVVDMGKRGVRQGVGKEPDGRGWSLHRADDRGVHGQPAGLLMAGAGRAEAFHPELSPVRGDRNGEERFPRRGDFPGPCRWDGACRGVLHGAAQVPRGPGERGTCSGNARRGAGRRNALRGANRRSARGGRASGCHRGDQSRGSLRIQRASAARIRPRSDLVPAIS